ncbi:uncharacterized protein LOC110453196 [Mizuhopecten yessoensis]|uniref:uncharacterized protein LOC110453196 n=1 Tax=Mizuhopecten yessoensis TaxID=6573 RepID=UPI000B45BD07|nr:uncharacterized protein LOC110453196 [Mizuhopecten yessoensis]
MDRFKQSTIARGFSRLTSRYRIFIDGIPFLMSLFVGGFFLSRISKKRFVKDVLNVPTKEEMLAAGIDIDTDLASAELEEELKNIKKSLNTEDWENVPITK